MKKITAPFEGELTVGDVILSAESWKIIRKTVEKNWESFDKKTQKKLETITLSEVQLG